MKDYCKKCKKRDKCTELCATCLEYVNQDQVDLNPIVYYMRDLHNIEEKQEWGNIRIDNSDKLIAIIIFLYKEGKSTREIAYHLPCSQQYISKIIKKYNDGDNQILEKFQQFQ